LKYLELHKRAKRKRQKEEEPTSTQQPEDFPPTDRPPDERPPDPPPPVRDKATRKLGGACFGVVLPVSTDSRSNIHRMYLESAIITLSVFVTLELRFNYHFMNSTNMV
jgi:hypothetical protein